MSDSYHIVCQPSVTHLPPYPLSLIPYPLSLPFLAPSAPPRGLRLSAESATLIFVSWSEVPAIARNGIITGYEVLYSAQEDYHNPEPLLQSTESLSLELSGLHEYANYSIQVKAYTEAGLGPYSDQQFIRTRTAGKGHLVAMHVQTIRDVVCIIYDQLFVF